VCGGGERIEGVVGIKTLSLKKKKKGKSDIWTLIVVQMNCCNEDLGIFLFFILRKKQSLVVMN
jgi:hypothetical protein